MLFLGIVICWEAETGEVREKATLACTLNCARPERTAPDLNANGQEIVRVLGLQGSEQPQQAGPGASSLGRDNIGGWSALPDHPTADAADNDPVDYRRQWGRG